MESKKCEPSDAERDMARSFGSTLRQMGLDPGSEEENLKSFHETQRKLLLILTAQLDTMSKSDFATTRDGFDALEKFDRLLWDTVLAGQAPRLSYFDPDFPTRIRDYKKALQPGTKKFQARFGLPEMGLSDDPRELAKLLRKYIETCG